MLERIGISSVFLTVLPSDGCSFWVRLYTKPQELVRIWIFYLAWKIQKLFSRDWLLSLQNFQHELPSLDDWDDKRCEVDLIFWQKERLQYPGACSLEYQNQMKILLEKLLCLGSSKQRATKNGVLGTVLAFMIAHEEQGRYMLHSHWQLFLKKLSMELRNVLFSSDAKEKRKQQKSSWRMLTKWWILLMALI